MRRRGRRSPVVRTPTNSGGPTRTSTGHGWWTVVSSSVTAAPSCGRWLRAAATRSSAAGPARTSGGWRFGTPPTDSCSSRRTGRATPWSGPTTSTRTRRSSGGRGRAGRLTWPAGDALRAGLRSPAVARGRRPRARPSAVCRASPPMPELPKAYDPATVEPVLYADWEAAGLFHADPDDEGEPFAVVIPPPNVTGVLHIGHALTNAIEDAMVRRARMQGKNAVWIPGMDHAGIATQNVVEKQLAAEGLSRHDLGRDAFVERVWTWKEEYGGRILDQLRRLGSSLDWDREAFTFDEPRSRAVREVFVALHEQGLIYRGNRITNWCPRCHTALSDIEVDHADDRGELARFRYPWADGGDDHGGGIEVATTRAETMLGDTAIAVHPDDERYADVVGREVRHPFQDRTFRVVADDYVDPEFGSGAVKITPAHDPNDHAIALRHDLEVIDILADDATLTEVVGGAVRGARPLRRASRGEAGARRAGPAARRRRPRALGRSLLALRHRGRTAPVGAVVRGRPPARGQGCGCRPGRAHAPGPRADDQELPRLARQPPRLDHLAADLVGAPHPRVVLPRRAHHRVARGPRRLRHVREGRARAGPGRPRHLVQLAAVALHHPRVAGTGGHHARAGALVPDGGPRDRLRHQHLLGVADADDRGCGSSTRCRST
jgi:hypothetical protein